MHLAGTFSFASQLSGETRTSSLPACAYRFTDHQFCKRCERPNLRGRRSVILSLVMPREVFGPKRGVELVDEPQSNRYPMPLNVG